VGRWVDEGNGSYTALWLYEGLCSSNSSACLGRGMWASGGDGDIGEVVVCLKTKGHVW